MFTRILRGGPSFPKSVVAHRQPYKTEEVNNGEERETPMNKRLGWEYTGSG